jgi:hypothetical protein
MSTEWPETERRRDINTRKVIEVLTEHFDSKFDEKLKGHVSWQGLAGSVVGLVGLIFVVVSAFMTPVKESAAQTRAEMKDVKGETAAAIREMRLDIRQISNEVRAVRSVTVDGQPRAAAKEALRRTNAEEKE